MASRKQFLVGFLIVLTVFLMLFFMTSDYNFSVSFRANSHPLHLKEETRGHPKYFGREEVEVAVYKGKEGDVVPEGLAPQGAGGPDRVVVINADEEKIMEEIAEEMKEEGGWMVGEEDREFPKIEINHDIEAKPVQPTDDIYTDALTTDQSTTTKETTEETTTTTTPPPTSTTTETSSVSTTDDRKRNRKVEVRRKKRDNMAHLTTNIPSSAPSSTPSTKTPTTSTQEQSQGQTESIQGVSVESSAPANLASSAQTTGSPPAEVETSTKTVSNSGVLVTDLSTTADKQSATETPEIITSASDFTTPNLSESKNITEQTVTDYESDKNSNSQRNGHYDNEVVHIENNQLPEEFLSDDVNNSDNSLV